MQPLKPLLKKDKEKIINRLFWDRKIDIAELDQIIKKRISNINDGDSQQFFAKLLTSCDWYTLLRLLPPEKLRMILNEQVLNRLFPKDLKKI